MKTQKSTKPAKRPAAPPNACAVELWPISRPTPYSKNARKLSDSAVQKCANSIKTFGFRQPIVVDCKDVIIAGHTRLLAAQQLGLAEVPVHVAGSLTPAQVKAYRLADNRTAAESTWDLDLLGPELLDLQGLNFDLALTGFDAMEMAQLLEPGIEPEWTGMPEFEEQDLEAWQTVKVHFASEVDREAFAQIVGQSLTDKTKFIWHPKAEIRHYVDKRYEVSEALNPRYPVYIVSKGRAANPLTAKALDRMTVPYRIVIEPQERDEYAAVIDPAKILTLPFSNPWTRRNPSAQLDLGAFCR